MKEKMRNTHLGVFSIGIFSVLFAGVANSALIPALDGQVVYDTELDITWMQDAAYIRTIGLDADGRGQWFNFMNYVDGLVFEGFDGWRLPTTLYPDSSCSDPSTSTGSGCTGSELGHLFNIDGISDDNWGPFINVLSWHYWSSTINPDLTTHTWRVAASNGAQDSFTTAFNEFPQGAGWFVHDGNIANVSAIPLPAAAWLFGSGLLGLIGIARKKAA